MGLPLIPPFQPYPLPLTQAKHGGDALVLAGGGVISPLGGPIIYWICMSCACLSGATLETLVTVYLSNVCLCAIRGETTVSGYLLFFFSYALQRANLTLFLLIHTLLITLYLCTSYPQLDG